MIVNIRYDFAGNYQKQRIYFDALAEWARAQRPSMAINYVEQDIDDPTLFEVSIIYRFDRKYPVSYHEAHSLVAAIFGQAAINARLNRYHVQSRLAARTNGQACYPVKVILAASEAAALRDARELYRIIDPVIVEENPIQPDLF